MNTITQKLNVSTTFTSKRKSGQNFEAFREFAEETGFKSSIPEIIRDDNNYISEGAFGKTFSIPQNDNFILKVDKRKPINTHFLALEQIPDVIPEINVGQAIARYGDSISVLIRQEGTEYGLPSHTSGMTNRQKIHLYINNLKKAAAIPQEGYNQFTDEVRIVRKHGRHLDIWNANNLLLTDENINIVDVGKLHKLGDKFRARISQTALLRALADEQHLRQLLPTLGKKDSARIGEQLEIISGKVRTAMKHSGLPTLNLFNKLLADCRDLVNPMDIERIETIIERLIKSSK